MKQVKGVPMNRLEVVGCLVLGLVSEIDLVLGERR